LHAQKVVHSDIHPRNVLVYSHGGVKLIDFGLARIAGSENEFRRAPRGGIGFFFEPEYAKAIKTRKQIPASSELGEQYALAALLYFLVTGSRYLDFSIEKHEMFQQIADDTPLPFDRRGIEAWPELERVLATALSKRTSDRFASVADFAEAMKAAALPQRLRIAA
jgi:serine/threonine protein kinase